MESKTRDTSSPTVSRYDHKQLKKRFRWIVSIVSAFIPATLLFNGVMIESVWLSSTIRGNTDSVNFKGMGSIIYRLVFIHFKLTSNINEVFTIEYYGSYIGQVFTVLISLALLYDFFSIKEFTKHGSGMSFRQKKMMISLNAFYIWICLGSFLIWITERYPFYRAVYFCYVTIKTIGFGDYTPSSSGSRTIVAIWFLIGAVILGTYLLDLSNFSSQMVYVLKDIQTSYDYDEDFHPDDISQHINNLLRRIPKDEMDSDESNSLSELSEASTSSSQSRISSESLAHRRQSHESLAAAVPPALLLAEIKRFEKELIDIKLRSFYYLVTIHFIFFIVSAGINYVFELGNWTFSDAFWFSFVSFTSLGYGDTVPNNKVTMAFFGLFVVFGISIFSSVIVLAVDIYITFTKKRINRFLYRLQ
ncbi:Outward-rectifier potassium channel TOK1 [Smittium mucronatum]|uniref:Outward-rectifier potassium channel TOK1 n=1 Tax=Smittium mucronatum TaxID=133383 RepID=A0A1R0H6E4_9FUNG|nr:Outward-rectifier potassium channel TOK1 [Smittium mucronatum]